MKRLSLILTVILSFTFGSNIVAQTPGQLAWSIPATSLPFFGATWSTPVVHDTVLYFFGQDGGHAAIHAKSGSLIWIDSTTYRGSLSHPAYHQGVLLIRNRADSLMAFNADDGSLRWAKRIAPKSNLSMPVKDGKAYLGLVGDSVVCIDVFSGVIDWVKNVNISGLCIHPSGSELVVVNVTDRKLEGWALNNGNVVKTISLPNDTSTLGNLAMKDDTVVIASTNDQAYDKVYGINYAGNSLLWTQKGLGVTMDYSAPSIDEGVTVMCLRKGTKIIVYSFDLSDGSVLWKDTINDLGLSRTSTVSLVDGKAFYPNYYNNNPRAFICANSKTGDTVYSTFPAFSFYILWGGILVHNDMLYGATDGNGIYAFHAGNVEGDWVGNGGVEYGTNSVSGQILAGVTDPNSAENTILIYPNPAIHMINLKGLVSGEGNYEIYSLDGKMITSGSFERYESVDVHYLSSGMYILRLNTEGEIRVRRFVKQ